jgi:hypothetical protein
MTIDLRLAAALALLLSACGGSNGASPAVRPPEPVVPNSPGRGPMEPIGAGKGSSDGVTCEQARDSYVEEVSVGAKGGQADLVASDFAAILNKGTYLDPCAVPSSSKLRICAAVQNGQAVGVTVASEPAAPEIEVCIAKEVRKLAFPANAKLDVVNVQF